MSGVRTETVKRDEAGMRLDRWFKARFPDLSHARLQKLLRTGQVRLDGARVKAGERVAEGQSVRVPPLTIASKENKSSSDSAEDTKSERSWGLSLEDQKFAQGLVIHRDQEVLALAKPSGLPVQGGSKSPRHLDGMLDALKFDYPERPRLVHRLDKDTSGVLLLARNRNAAAWLGRALKERQAQKLYWGLVVGVPRPGDGRIDAALAKRGRPGEERVRVAGADDGDAQRALTDYQVLETAGQKFAWVALQPLTGRTHQLRAHMAAFGHPIVGDRKYGGGKADPGGELICKLHLHARMISITRPNGRVLEVAAPLESHMRETWSLLGFDAGRVPEFLEGQD